MAQLRDAYRDFKDRGTEIVVVGPEKASTFEAYWRKHRLPFKGVPDPSHRILKLYGQQVKLFKLGRMPAQVVVDRESRVRFVHYGHSMVDIPTNDDIFSILNQLNDEEAK
jgi:peroxiredoxin